MSFKIQNFLETMISKNYNRLTKSEKKVAEFILNNPEEAAFLSSTRVGQEAGVSEATVVRFSTGVGCSGFPGLQEILQNYVKERIKPSEKLKKYAKMKKKADICGEIFHSTIQNLQMTYDNIRPEMLDQIVSKIVMANKVYVAGFRRSFSVAFLLYYNLGSLLKNVVLIDSSYGLLHDKTIEIKKNDICFGISFPRYATQTYQIIKHAKERECLTVVITDSLVSPIAQIADHIFTAKYEIPSFFHSNVCAMALIDCIVAGVSRKKQKSIKLLSNLEKSLKDWNTWLIT